MPSKSEISTKRNPEAKHKSLLFQLLVRVVQETLKTSQAIAILRSCSTEVEGKPL